MKRILVLKAIVYVISLIIGLSNFLLFLLILLILNIPLLRKSVFGRLPTDTKALRKSGVLRFYESYEYLPKLKLDIYYPVGYFHKNASHMTQDMREEIVKSAKGIVLFAHGGGWITGYRRQPNNTSWYRYLVSEGFIVATIDYARGYKAVIEQLVDELGIALQFVKGIMKKQRVERKISLMGLSAGGHLALLTASRFPEDVDSVVAYYVPCDLLDIWKSPSIFARIAAATTLKRLPNKDRYIYEKYSPINNLNRNFPKTLLVHGLKDSVVPYHSSVKMFKKLRENGITSKLLLHHFGNHGFEFVLRDKRTVDIIEKTCAFLEGQLW
ncbi:peptidase S9 [Fervidobacterium riparium]|nr:peptidase S9 [Fervidobacterium riparium]